MISREEASELLGVEENASDETIKEEFRRLSKDLYPGRPGGDRERWELLLEARDALLGRNGGDDLLPATLVRDLVRAQETAIEGIREHYERKDARQSTTQTVVRRHTSRLDQRKRNAWAMAAIAGGIGILVTLLRAIVLTDPGERYNGLFAVVIAALGILAGGAALLAWALRLRAERLGQAIEDVTAQLSQRADFLQLLNEIRREGDREPPWTVGALNEAIEHWTRRIGSNEPSSLASTALDIGPGDFRRLIVSKGVELDLLTETTIESDGDFSTIYAPARVESVESA